MKITAFQLFKLAVAVGAGYEFGRSLPQAVAIALNKDSRMQYKKVYRDTMAKETARQSTIRVVPDQSSETPTK